MLGMDEKSQEEKRRLRKEYRKLLTETEANRYEIVQENQALVETIQRANALYADVSDPQEALLDSRVLVLSSDLASIRAQKLKLEYKAFDVDEFLLKLGTLKELGKVALKYMDIVPRVDTLLGPLDVEQKVRKQARKQRRMEAQGELQEPEERHENDTTKNVLLLAEILENVQEESVNMFRFIVNPESFSQTVENMFYLSFLIRDGTAAIDMQDGQPVVYRSDPPTAEQLAEGLEKRQFVMEMDMEFWRELIQVYNITESMIPTRTKVALETGKWYG